MLQLAFYLELYQRTRGFLLLANPEGVFLWQVHIPQKLASFVQQFFDFKLTKPISFDFNFGFELSLHTAIVIKESGAEDWKTGRDAVDTFMKQSLKIQRQITAFRYSVHEESNRCFEISPLNYQDKQCDQIVFCDDGIFGGEYFLISHTINSYH